MHRLLCSALAIVLASVTATGEAVSQKQAAKNQKHWTLGSPSSVVAEIQGQPDLIERLESLGVRVWHFGNSVVRLSYSDSHVIGWSNTGELRVELKPGRDTLSGQSFAVGSRRDDVVRIEGTPSALFTRGDEEVMQFRRASVRIGSTDARVRGWTDPDNALHVGDTPVLPVASAPPPRGRATSPASLTATLRFADDGDDGVLDAQERATITAIVRNTGHGVAYDARLTVNAPGITLISATRADSIPAGRSTTISAVIAGAANLKDGEALLTVGVNEARGFDLDPEQKLRVRTRGVLAPHFAVDGVGISDQSGNGRIEPREIVDVTARIVNRGPGDARDVRAALSPDANTTLTPESPRELVVGTMRAGEVRDIHFTAFTNSRASALAISLALSESRTRFDTSLTVSLPLDRPIAAAPSLVVRGNDRRPVAPAPLIVDVDTGVPRAPRARNTLAVVLGVERYQRAPSVPFARHDAAVFREYAAKLFGVGDDADRLYFRTDDEVTGGELRKVFGEGGWLARRVSPETDVVVYFAGHGVADLKTHAPYLLPNDADPNYPAQTGYALNEMYEKLAALHAKSVTVFIDACFSGGTRDGGSLFAGARDVVVSVEHPALRSETMAVFTASEGNQLANVASDRKHGLMTYWLLKGLRGGADGDADTYVTVSELEKFLRANVPGDAAKQDREQTPQAVARNKARIIVGLPR